MNRDPSHPETRVPHAPSPVETAGLTVLALLAFASNSLLTRAALGGRHIDAASFTAVRLGAGALTLTALAAVRARGWPRLRRRFVTGPLALFGYAAPFSFAYLRIGAATGTLVAFGAVQLTMIGWGVARGERPLPRVWVGLGLAVAGLLWLALPSASAPDPIGVGLMVVAGISWGVYSLAGKAAGEPLAANAASFLGSLPLVLGLSLICPASATATRRGLVLALVSGAVTSGLGYAIWYRALRGLSATKAAVVQLTTPVIAALGAVVFLHEQPSERLAVAGLAVLGGTALALSARRPPAPRA